MIQRHEVGDDGLRERVSAFEGRVPLGEGPLDAPCAALDVETVNPVPVGVARPRSIGGRLFQGDHRLAATCDEAVDRLRSRIEGFPDERVRMLAEMIFRVKQEELEQRGARRRRSDRAPLRTPRPLAGRDRRGRQGRPRGTGRRQGGAGERRRRQGRAGGSLERARQHAGGSASRTCRAVVDARVGVRSAVKEPDEVVEAPRLHVEQHVAGAQIGQGEPRRRPGLGQACRYVCLHVHLRGRDSPLQPDSPRGPSC